MTDYITTGYEAKNTQEEAPTAHILATLNGWQFSKVISTYSFTFGLLYQVREDALCQIKKINPLDLWLSGHEAKNTKEEAPKSLILVTLNEW